MQSEAASRRGAAQISHSSPSVSMRQRRQCTTPVTASSSARASARPPSRLRSSRWKAIRWADFGPTPGSTRRASMGRASPGEYFTAAPSERELHARRELHAAHGAGHVLLHGFADAPRRVVAGRGHEVLEHLAVGARDRRVELDAPHFVAPVHDDLHHAAAGLAGDLERAELLLRLLHVFLQLLRLAHQLPEIRLHGRSLPDRLDRVRLQDRAEALAQGLDARVLLERRARLLEALVAGLFFAPGRRVAGAALLDLDRRRLAHEPPEGLREAFLELARVQRARALVEQEAEPVALARNELAMARELTRRALELETREQLGPFAGGGNGSRGDPRAG